MAMAKVVTGAFAAGLSKCRLQRRERLRAATLNEECRPQNPQKIRVTGSLFQRDPGKLFGSTKVVAFDRSPPVVEVLLPSFCFSHYILSRANCGVISSKAVCSTPRKLSKACGVWRRPPRAKRGASELEVANCDLKMATS